MIHLSDLSLLQFNLIEIGVLFQLMAFGTYLKEQSTWGTLSRHRREKGDGDHDDGEARREDRGGLDHARPTPGERLENARHEIDMGEFTKTAKPKFVQSFKFRSGRLQRR